jgi:hypothetical protein
MAGLLGAGLGLLGSLGSSIITNKGAKNRQALAYQQNIKFWNMQNAYNTPKEQMKRLQEAGLNPNLIYSSGQGATGVAGSVSPSKPAPYNIQNPVPSALSTALYKPQVKEIESKISLNNSNELKNYADSKLKGSQKKQIDALIAGKIRELDIRNNTNQIKYEIGAETKQSEINKIIANSDTAGYIASIKTTEAEYASRGLKMDQIGQVFTALNMDPRDPEDQKIFQGLMATWFTTGVLSKLLSKSLIEKIVKRFALKIKL